MRVVVVVGGALSDGSKLPLWDDAMNGPVEARLRSMLAEHEVLFRELWARLAPDPPGTSQSEGLDLELLKRVASLPEICSVATGFSTLGRGLREQLRKLYTATWGERAPGDMRGEAEGDLAEPRPQLAYELLAHLVKHGFVDHVVSFNFDDLLENTLDNEIGPDGYDLIVSDRQPLPLALPRRPRLIKLHGTVRVPVTLRFTPEDTRLITPELANLLDDTFFGTDGDGGAPPIVHLVSLGYSWRDRDFSNWVVHRTDLLRSLLVTRLNSKLPEFLQVTRDSGCMRPTNPERDVLDDLRSKTRVLSAEECSTDGTTVSLDDLLWAVWDQVASELDEANRVVPAARHFALHCLFRHGESAQPHTAVRRFYVEALLHLLKCKGMVNASTMARTHRIHRYKRCATRSSEQDRRWLDTALGGLWKESGHSDVRETFFCRHETPMACLDELVRRFGRLTETERVPSIGEDGRISRAAPITHEDALRDFFRQVFESDEIELIGGIDPRVEWLFECPTPIENTLSLQRTTAALLRDKRWTHLLMVAETGGWIGRPDSRSALESESGGERLALLVQTSMRGLDDWVMFKETIRGQLDDQWQCLEKDGVHVLRAQLAWWKHNRHLTLAFNANAGEFIGGVYFRRRLKSSQVSPVYVRSTQDCAELLFTFLSYTERAVDEWARAAVVDPSGAGALKKELVKMVEEVLQVARSVRLDGDLADRRGLLVKRLDDAMKRQATLRLQVCTRAAASQLSSAEPQASDGGLGS